MEVLSTGSNEPPELLTNVEVRSLLLTNMQATKMRAGKESDSEQFHNKVLKYLKKSSVDNGHFNEKAIKSAPGQPSAQIGAEYLAKCADLLKLLRSDGFHLEEVEIMQIVNILPGNRPLLTVIISEFEERFTEEMQDRIEEEIKKVSAKP